MSRYAWYRVRTMAWFLFSMALFVGLLVVLSGSLVKRVQDGPPGIREEVELIQRCRMNGDVPWADERGYVHCLPVTSEVL